MAISTIRNFGHWQPIWEAKARAKAEAKRYIQLHMVGLGWQFQYLVWTGFGDGVVQHLVVCYAPVIE
jgi:hypothetical protein